MGYKGQKKLDYQLNWMKKRREKYLAKMGSCYFCDSFDDLEIHHIDPQEKDTHRIWSLSDEKIRQELEKCVAICNTCHTRYHALQLMKPYVHGKCHTYNKYGCRCNDCVQARSEYNREYRKNVKNPKNAQICQ
jgi:hypothetical protein